MYLLIRHDGNVYRAEPRESDNQSPAKRCDLPDNMLAYCWSDGQVDIVAPNYHGFGSWDVDHVTPGMAEFLAECIDECSDENGVSAILLAESTADGFDLFDRDGSIPEWLSSEAYRIVAEWRRTHG